MSHEMHVLQDLKEGIIDLALELRGVPKDQRPNLEQFIERLRKNDIMPPATNTKAEVAEIVRIIFGMCFSNNLSKLQSAIKSNDALLQSFHKSFVEPLDKPRKTKSNMKRK